MLSSARCQTALPAADLDRARRFYEETLGFLPVDVQPRGVRYEAAGGARFLVFPSSGRASGRHTQIGFQVDDIAAEVAELRSRGVVFETYDMPVRPRDDVRDVPDRPLRLVQGHRGNLIGVELPATSEPSPGDGVRPRDGCAPGVRGRASGEETLSICRGARRLRRHGRGHGAGGSTSAASQRGRHRVAQGQWRDRPAEQERDDAIPCVDGAE
jgi:catechol 2,3-dioxygenase-like lactoylglutathione lyase family enzyme